MLRIYYGDLEAENYIFNPGAFFDNTYEEDWITDPFSMQVIRDIDKSEVVDPGLVDSPFLGRIPIERISRGAKTLILMYFDSGHVFNASMCGDNCAPWILKIGQMKDVTIRLGYLMRFGDAPFEIEVANLHKVVHSLRELNETVLDHHLI